MVSSEEEASFASTETQNIARASLSHRTAYVKSMHVPGLPPGKRTTLAYPTKPGECVVNIVCGPNNCGKTHILSELAKALRNCLRAGKQPIPPTEMFTLTSDVAQIPKAVFLSKTWRHKDEGGTIGLDRTTELPLDRGDARASLLKFLLRQLCVHIPDARSLDLAKWIESPSARMEIVKNLKSEEEIYVCDQADPLVRRLQELLEANLYLQRLHVKKGPKGEPKDDLKLVLLNNRQNCIPFDKWSDGQKALLYLALVIEFELPDVLLIDELENHMHPLFMTKAIALIKERVPQVIVATHHPHLIFSVLADRVLYFEIEEPGMLVDPPFRMKFEKRHTQPAPKRAVTVLEDDFAKISAAYKLFDLQDRQLMKQAATIQHDADLLFYEQLRTAFTSEEVGASTRPLPDRQTQQIVEAIRASRQSGEDPGGLRVLDIGAGLGRVEREAAKLTSWQQGVSLEWICWAHTDAGRTALRRELNALKPTPLIPTSLDEIPDHSCDGVVMANVLHEVNPETFADLLVTAVRKATAPGGIIFIAELYPLLRPEKYAVAYPLTWMSYLLKDIGFVCAETSFAIREVTGYTIYAKHQHAHAATEAEVIAAIERVWQELERDIASRYAVRQNIHSSSDYRSMLTDLTTLASIQAARRGLWK